jgi:hypothetical protein
LLLPPKPNDLSLAKQDENKTANGVLMQRRPSCQELQEEVRQSEQEKWPEHKGLREKLKKRTRELNCL